MKLKVIVCLTKLKSGEETQIIEIMSAVRALALEYKSLQEDMVEGFRVKLNNENLFEWDVNMNNFEHLVKIF